jgi:hypothetical protein
MINIEQQLKLFCLEGIIVFAVLTGLFLGNQWAQAINKGYMVRLQVCAGDITDNEALVKLRQSTLVRPYQWALAEYNAAQCPKE